VRPVEGVEVPERDRANSTSAIDVEVTGAWPGSCFWPLSEGNLTDLERAYTAAQAEIARYGSSGRRCGR